MTHVLTPDHVELLERSVLAWLATADAEGVPNVSPKEIFVPAAEDRILIADIASPRSVRNIRVNQAVCVAAIDVFDQRGIQVLGSASIVAESDSAFTEVAGPLMAIAGPDFQIRHVIEVRASKVRPIIAPSYWANPDLSESERRARTLATYGVLDRQRQQGL